MISQTLKTESMLKKIYSGLPHNKYTLINKQAVVILNLLHEKLCARRKDFFKSIMLVYQTGQSKTKNAKKNKTIQTFGVTFSNKRK